MHCNNSEAPTRLVVFLGHRTSADAPDAVPSGQYDPTGHLFCEKDVDRFQKVLIVRIVGERGIPGFLCSARELSECTTGVNLIMEVKYVS